MVRRLLLATTLTGSIGLGVAVGFIASQAGDAGEIPDSVQSITGVASGTGGSTAKKEDSKGVQVVTPDSESPDAAESKQDQSSADDPTIEIEGVQGSDGTTVPPENTIESVNEGHGSIETIRGIEGIDTVMLQNLEAVLRMQQRPQEQQSQGGARTAAALLTMEPSEEEPVEEVIDGRQVHVEYDLEGS